MAFHQPTRHAVQRAIRVETEDREPQTAQPQQPQGTDESQTWVLFSPATDAGTTTSYLSAVQESQQTPGRSRLSDLGSLNTLVRSDINSQPANSAVHHVLSDVMDEVSVEDDAELDSLDSHLPSFRSAPKLYHQMQSSATVLPTHDGLGSFRLDTTGMSSEMQEQIYAFERFNPRRVKRRRESPDLAQLEIENGQAQEIDRNRRIEAWRLEQSKLLLDEVQKETRRRRLSEASSQKSRIEMAAAEDIAMMSSVGDVTPDTTTLGSEWHDHEAMREVCNQGGMWSRLARKFMREFMGINDRMLAILLGVALPEDEELSSTPKASASAPFTQAKAESQHDSSWQLHMVERVAKELGLLVHRMSAHPGAFSAYVRMQQQPLPYAGLPVIPEAVADMNEASGQGVEESTPSIPQFQPTIGQTQPIDIRGRAAEVPSETTADITLNGQSGATFTQQEWEQDLDIKLVFRYLRSHFMSRSSSSTAGTAHLATSSTQDAAAKAARVRLHHPLVGRARQAERRTYRVATPSSPAAIRHASSCASQSTRRSARRSSVSSRHSSRHYWDIGGSIGTGSLIASTGPMGSWGEV